MRVSSVNTEAMSVYFMVSFVEEYDTCSDIHGSVAVRSTMSTVHGGFVHGGILHVQCTSWECSWTKGTFPVCFAPPSVINQVSDGAI
jgi:hypothetical protein